MVSKGGLAAGVALMAWTVLVGADVRAAETAEPKTTIEEVAVYADRAQVTRVGTVDLSAGQVAIGGLPGWIDAESVRVALEPPERGRIVDVTVETTHLAKAPEAAVQKAEQAVVDAQDALRVIDDERQVIAAEIEHLKSIRAFSLKNLPRDMAVKGAKISKYGETIDFVSDRLRRARKALRDADGKRRELLPELAKRQKELGELRAQAKLQQSRVVIALEGSGRAKLRLVYMTPGASWEPVAELRTSGAETAEIVQAATVVNTTGEDWNGAALTFSTQRPGELLEVPAAQALLLDGKNGTLGGEVARMGASFDKASSTYMAQNASAARNDAKLSAGLARQRNLQARALQTFQQLQQRGTTAHFTARAARAVRADGRPVRVPIAKAKLAPSIHLVAVPMVSLNAVVTAEFVNTTDQSILPGDVALFVDGAFVGKSRLPFVSPGEKFSAFLGVNDRVKLERTVDRKRSRIERGRKRTELVASFLVSAENLGKTPITIDLTDRVPVSQNEEIEVDDVEIPEGATRSREGIIKWTATLAPGKRYVWRIQYELEYPNAIAAQARQERQKRKSRAPAAAPSERDYLFEGIDQLENML